MTHFSQHTQFWLALLTHPCSVEQRSRIWNGYLAWKLPQDFQHEIRNVGNPPFNQFARNERLQLSEEEKTELDALAEKHGGHPQLSDTSIGTPTRYMDFSDYAFNDEVNFSGRILINVSFNKSMFNSLADFRNATFVGTSDFNNAKFWDRSRFDDVAFENTVYFKKTRFQETTVFDGAKFSSAAYFDESQFLPATGTGKHALARFIQRRPDDEVANVA